ncbi:hypothetical protein AC579_7072 [Pseudocercospora musae]|uniref:BZIP domain-containing protein n=1 Tax=Pseudocercospora musae TaxID=113226 RepID=A0A139HZ98_9PEZI|nr:hypothetical protein AC579_7072 [Pseudocercospora musae]
MSEPSPPAAATTKYPSYAIQPNGTQPEYRQAQAVENANAALSQSENSDHTPTPNNVAAANGRKRRATGAPGSRGVANLTPEQLAKKRANDREAQRAIRERTRNTIDGLERRIRELESQQPFQDLQRVVQERDQALAECEELRRRLGAVAGIVGGAAQHPSLNGMFFAFDDLVDSSLLTDENVELAALTAQQSPLPPAASGTTQQAYSQAQGPQRQYEESTQGNLHPDLRQPSDHATPESQGHANGYSGAEVSTSGLICVGGATLRRFSPGSHQQAAQSSPNGVPYEHQQRSPSAHPPQHQNHGERLGVNFLLDSKSDRQHASISPTMPSFHRSQLEKPVYAQVTNVGPPSSPLDSLLIDFMNRHRTMLRDGASIEDAIGPEYPSFSAMLDSRSRCHPVSSLLIDILSKFPDIDSLPEKVAVLYVMFLILRWQICPCEKCYERLPEWARPTKEQTRESHSAWNDHLPWPHVRRQLTLGGHKFKFEDFFVPFTTTLSLNWPLPQDCVLISIPSSNPTQPAQLTLNPAFEHHLRSLENWSVGSLFSKTFPELVDRTVRVSDP